MHPGRKVLNSGRLLALFASFAVFGIVAHPLQAQEQVPPPAAQTPQQNTTTNEAESRLTDAQIQQLVAPIALYPDNLLGQIFAASTYPLDVIKAARWVQQNPGVKGKDLEAAMQQQPWDPSVKGLTSVPQVLQMMNDKLDWTQQLGEAYLAQPDDVSKAIQVLRAKADANGNLKTTKELKVVKRPRPPSDVVYVDEPYYIEIEPFEPDYIYVPIYDPFVVYGPWLYADYLPFFWYPPGFVYGGAIAFGPVFFIGPALWCNYNWYSHRVFIATTKYNQFNHTKLASIGNTLQWKHDPVRRGNVPYKNLKLQKQFSSIKPTGKGAGQGVLGPAGKLTTFPKGQTSKGLKTQSTISKGLKTQSKIKSSTVTTGPKLKGTSSFKGTNIHRGPSHRVGGGQKFSTPKFSSGPTGRAGFSGGGKPGGGTLGGGHKPGGGVGRHR